LAAATAAASIDARSWLSETTQTFIAAPSIRGRDRVALDLPSDQAAVPPDARARPRRNRERWQPRQGPAIEERDELRSVAMRVHPPGIVAGMVDEF